MTIRDLIESGIEIQGWVKVQRWDDDAEDTIVLFVNKPRAAFVLFPDNVIDKEIKYMWASSDYKTMENGGEIESPILVIEI